MGRNKSNYKQHGTHFGVNIVITKSTSAPYYLNRDYTNSTLSEMELEDSRSAWLNMPKRRKDYLNRELPDR